ncbi:unnamed protein product [Caretta caretta]
MSTVTKEEQKLSDKGKNYIPRRDTNRKTDPAANPGEALGQEEPDREEGLWRPGLPAAEYPEDLEGPGCNPGQREPDTEQELELPAAEYPDELEGPERPT